MGSLLLQILPVAVAIALEPVCVLAALLMPATRRPVGNAVAYAGALTGIMFVYGALAVLLLRGRAAAAGTSTDDIVQVLWLFIGVGFSIAFIVILLRRPKAGSAPREPAWMRWVSRMGPLGAAGVGAFLVNWEMETPAITDLVKAHLPAVRSLTALALFTAVAVSTSVVPLAAYLVAPERVGGALTAGTAWLARHQRIIMLLLFSVIGAAYTFKGAAALLRG